MSALRVPEVTIRAIAQVSNTTTTLQGPTTLVKLAPPSPTHAPEEALDLPICVVPGLALGLWTVVGTCAREG